MTQRRPSVVKVSTIHYFIDYTRDLRKKEVVGLCHNRIQEIHIDKGVTEENRRAILMHELLHAVCYMYGLPLGGKDPEEAIVNAWGTGLTQLLTDNPGLAEYIAGR